VSLATDPINCGACLTPCGDMCQGGQCVQDCGPGMQDCTDYCTDTETDPLNCGDCGEVCARDEICVEGGCRRFRPTGDCNQCPCQACTGDFALCCTYPGGVDPICVDHDRCQ
jgi:hypothetical protein